MDINPEALEAFSINEAYENSWQQALSDKIAYAVAGRLSTPVNQIPSDVLQHIKSQEQRINELQQQLSQVSIKADESYNYVTPRRATQLDLIKLFGRERVELNPTARTPIDDMKRELIPFALARKVDINWQEIPSLLKQGLGLVKKNTGGAYYYEGGRLKQPESSPGTVNLPAVNIIPQSSRSAKNNISNGSTSSTPTTPITFNRAANS